MKAQATMPKDLVTPLVAFEAVSSGNICRHDYKTGCSVAKLRLKPPRAKLGAAHLRY
jgi:hypothetical protein